MEIESWRRFRNPEPPSDDFDFETTTVKNHLKNLLGDLTQFVITEDAFYYSSGCSEFSESSDDSDISVQSKIPDKVPLKTPDKVPSKTPDKVPSKTPDKVPSKTPDIVIKKEKVSSPPKQKTSYVNLSDEEDSRKERKRPKISKRRSPKRWSGIEYSDSEDSYEELLEEYKNNKSKIKVENEKVKLENIPVKQEYKSFDEVEKAFGVYHCNVCNIQLNSEVTYQTHIRGKRHIKAVNAESISNIAKMSLDSKSNEVPYIPSRRPDLAAPRKNFIRVDKVSYIQELVDTYSKGPLPGLSQVIELRTRDKKETSYYCKLCQSPCSTQSIMPHLTGYKHQLRCLEIIDRKSYDHYSYQPKKLVESKIIRILSDHERDNKRGLIQVEEEAEDVPLPPRYDAYDPYNQPGPSRSNEPTAGFEPSTSGAWDGEMNISCKEDLDMSRNDYYCLTCYSHMNNRNMWEAHVRGKRHLKNKKKIPGESASKLRAIPCPDKTAHLLHLIKNIEEPIVGLDYLSETQNEAGYMYQCHLCGACATDNDIVDHILTTKHRTKYLEKLHNNGKPNSIVSINSLFGVTCKDSLVEEECLIVLKQYPPERGVQVYKTKGLRPYGSRY